MNIAVGKESLSFVSDTSKTSTLTMICDARNWNFFLVEFISICAKMRRLGFSSLNDFRSIFWCLSLSFSLSILLLDILDFSIQIANSFPSAILVCLSFFQNFLIRFKKFIAKPRDTDSFKCKLFRVKCALMIFLLSTIINISLSIFNWSRWLVHWLTKSNQLMVFFSLMGVTIDAGGKSLLFKAFSSKNMMLSDFIVTVYFNKCILLSKCELLSTGLARKK